METSLRETNRPFGARGLRGVRGRVTDRVTHYFTHAITYTVTHNRREFETDHSFDEALVNTSWSPEETDDLDTRRLQDIHGYKQHCRSTDTITTTIPHTLTHSLTHSLTTGTPTPHYEKRKRTMATGMEETKTRTTPNHHLPPVTLLLLRFGYTHSFT